MASLKDLAEKLKGFMVQNPAPSQWVAKQIPFVNNIQQKLQQAELARINYQRESNNGVVGKRLLSNPIAGIGAAQVQRMAQSVPQIAMSAARLTPPALGFNTYMAAQQKNPQFAKQTGTDLYNVAKGIGYATQPIGTAIGGAFGLGVQGIGNKINGKRFINPMTYAEDYAKNADQMAAFQAISAANPLFRAKLSQPIIKDGGMMNKSQKFLESIPNQMINRTSLNTIREGAEGAVTGAIRPLDKGETRRDALANDVLTGALMGAVLQFGTDYNNVKLKPILKKIGVGLRDYVEFVQEGLGKGRFVKTKNNNLRARGYKPTGVFNEPMEELGSRAKLGQQSDDLLAEAKKYKSAEEFVKAQPTLSKAERQAVEGSASMKAYINDTTPLGRGVEIHEMTERPIYFNTPKAGQGKLPAGHTQALDAEINYYKSLVPELNKYKTSEIDNVVVKRLQEKYGKGIYGNELSSPIPFKAKTATEQKIYNLIKNKLEKIDTKSQLTDIWNKAHSEPVMETLSSTVSTGKPQTGGVGGVGDLTDVKKRLMNVYILSDADRIIVQNAKTAEDLAPVLRKLEGGSLAKFFNSGKGQVRNVTQPPVPPSGVGGAPEGGTKPFVKIKANGNPVVPEAKPQQTQGARGLPPSQIQQPAGGQLAPMLRGTPAIVEPQGKIQPSTQVLQGRTEGTLQPQTNLSGQQVSSDTIIPRKNNWTFNILDKAYQEYVNRFHGMEKLAGQAGQGKKLQGDLAQYYGSASTAQYHLENELSPILKEQNIDDLRQAAVAMRDVELTNRGIKGSPEQKKAQENLSALEARLGPEKMKAVGETLKRLYAYQDGMVRKYLVDTGIMSESSYAAMKKNNQFYVPFKRVMDQVDEMLGIPVRRGAGSIGKQNVVYGIKGSDKDIVDPVESIIENTYKLVSLGRRQQVAQTISGLSKELPDLVKRVASGDQRNTITLFENGKKVYYQVPEEVAEAARGLGQESLIMLAKILKIPTDLFRTMTTGVNPEFFFPNVSRDVQSAWFNRGVNPLKWVAGLAHYIKRDDVYKDFLKSGGKTGLVQMNRPFLKVSAEELSGKGKVVKNPVEFLEAWSMASEQPTRIASFQKAYKDAIKNGLSKEEAMREAAYWAQEGTVNFARKGSKMTNINAIYAYLNARIQGVDRMIRSAKENPVGTSARFAIGFMAPALGLYAWNSQNPDYYNDRIVSKRDKQDNFIFMLPKEVNGVRYLKLPKSEIAKVVNPVESFLDYAQGKGGDIASSIGNVLLSFSPIDNFGGLIPTAINPIVENAVNKDFYTGYDIVPDYKKNLPKGYQDSPYTSPLFRMIGRKTNQSPALLQNLAESYGGGMMRIAEMGSQPFIPAEYTSKKNEQGAPINRTPILRRFMGGEKKTEEEQIKANESKAKAIEFDVNDIKAAVNRGDIPFEVGRQRIESLRQQVPAGSGAKSSATQQGKMVSFINSEGKYQEIDTSFQPTPPKLTGLSELDKKAISKFNGEITSKGNDIYDLYKAGKLTMDEANTQLDALIQLKASVGTTGASGGKKKSAKKITIKSSKPKSIKFSLPKSAKIQNIKIAKLAKPKQSKTKSVKIAKVSPIKIKKIKGLSAGTKLI